MNPVFEDILEAFKDPLAKFLGFELQFPLTQHIPDKFAWGGVERSVAGMFVNELPKFVGEGEV